MAAMLRRSVGTFHFANLIRGCIANLGVRNAFHEARGATWTDRVGEGAVHGRERGATIGARSCTRRASVVLGAPQPHGVGPPNIGVCVCGLLLAFSPTSSDDPTCGTPVSSRDGLGVAFTFMTDLVWSLECCPRRARHTNTGSQLFSSRLQKRALR